jgi:hypothetical protein
VWKSLELELALGPLFQFRQLAGGDHHIQVQTNQRLDIGVDASSANDAKPAAQLVKQCKEAVEKG